MPKPWTEDRRRDRLLIEANTLDVAHAIVRDAGSRFAPTTDMVRGWHAGLYRDVPVPVPYYVGQFRDSDPRHPDLMTYEVAVGSVRGAPCSEVMDRLARFERQMQAATTRLDLVVAAGRPPHDGSSLLSVLLLSANAHGEWIRIHPFANGNGRTARLLVLWVGLRYGLPPYLRIKPRPGGRPYADASAASMKGDHTPMVTVLNDMLADRMRGGSGRP